MCAGTDNDELAYFPLPITSEFAMYIREQVISGAVLTETRSTAYEDLTSKALLRCLVFVGSPEMFSRSWQLARWIVATTCDEYTL